MAHVTSEGLLSHKCGEQTTISSQTSETNATTGQQSRRLLHINLFPLEVWSGKIWYMAVMMVACTQLSPALPFLISSWNSFWGHLLLILHLASFWFSVLSLHLPLCNFLTLDFKLAYCFDNLRSIDCIWLTKHSHAGEGLRKCSMCQEPWVISNTRHPSFCGHEAGVISTGKALCLNAERQTKLCFYKST